MEKTFSRDVRATPLLRVKVKFTVKNAVCESLRPTASGECDCEFGFDSQEWSCSRSHREVYAGLTPKTGSVCFGLRCHYKSSHLAACDWGDL